MKCAAIEYCFPLEQMAASLYPGKKFILAVGETTAVTPDWQIIDTLSFQRTFY